MARVRIRYGWDHPLTAERYERFCAGATRYGFANEALVRAARIETPARVLDFGAGLGHTAEAVLVTAPGAQIVCVEPALAMREAGQRRLGGDRRVEWAERLPVGARFDRVLSGAALWQVDDLERTLAELRALLAADGRLCFTIPSLYLGVPDRPGAGRDPLLVELFAALSRGRVPLAEAGARLPGEAELVGWLVELGLETELERLEYRLTQRELRDWVRIPVLTDALLPELDAAARDELIDAAYAASDSAAYRFEGWTVVSATAPV
jgi:SAM-dependent methyltransferase